MKGIDCDSAAEGSDYVAIRYVVASGRFQDHRAQERVTGPAPDIAAIRGFISKVFM